MRRDSPCATTRRTARPASRESFTDSSVPWPRSADAAQEDAQDQVADAGLLRRGKPHVALHLHLQREPLGAGGVADDLDGALGELGEVHRRGQGGRTRREELAEVLEQDVHAG